MPRVEKEIMKHFPSDPDRKKVTFLTDKKVDAQLYGYLMELSYPEGPKGEELTVVYKSQLPTQAEICKITGIGSRSTYKRHLDYLIEKGYIIEEESRYIIDTRKENIYLQIDLDTVIFLNNTVKEPVWKAYIYLGQRWKWRGNQFVFTREDLAVHIGVKPNNNSSVYTYINNILDSLQNNGLIKVEVFSDGKTQRMRLIEFNFHHKSSF